jgi:hypothetical protein
VRQRVARALLLPRLMSGEIIVEPEDRSSMKAEERTISNILTEQICYEIPPYQRPYSWEKENVQQLLDDIWEAYTEKDSEYFIGSLITIERERDRRYDVVDGQQRLTTLNLILARMRDQITDDAVKADLGKRILPRNVYTGEAETPRLLLRRRISTFSVSTCWKHRRCRAKIVRTWRPHAAIWLRTVKWWAPSASQTLSRN